ncbi:hypothetical protein A4R35_21010 [Thermogemmatispora tikiterensis]|uniref:Uncharacterized protein n=1 Tax=Thermogemmatispora tikiterensis TaxID=1825093 RepID=A0A328VQR6_9CHLR|nr:hypothetical protein A4R35_21010 [Thermogemmatispora tikiterensis]
MLELNQEICLLAKVGQGTRFLAGGEQGVAHLFDGDLPASREAQVQGFVDSSKASFADKGDNAVASAE